jgi:transcriptional regulator with XRE-family HTH domain
LADGKKIVAQHLRYWTKTLGIKGVDIADRLEVSPSTVSAWLSGRNPIDSASLGVIAELCGLPLIEFVRDEEDERKHASNPAARQDEAERALRILAARAGIEVRIEPRKKH